MAHGARVKNARLLLFRCVMALAISQCNSPTTTIEFSPPCLCFVLVCAGSCPSASAALGYTVVFGGGVKESEWGLGRPIPEQPP